MRFDGIQIWTHPTILANLHIIFCKWKKNDSKNPFFTCFHIS